MNMQYRLDSEMSTFDQESPRSWLYNLQPIGLGTAYVESLTSYVARLARLYCISPNALLQHILLPYIKESPEYQLWLEGLNGMTPLAGNIVQLLERLTSCNTLKFLTMLPWGNITAQIGVVNSKRTWCPACYYEWQETQHEIYDLLIWSIRDLKICSLHNCRLLHQCPNDDCRYQLPLFDSAAKAGFCSKCGHFLGFSVFSEKFQQEERDRKQQEWDGWVSSVVGEFIASLPNMEILPTREAFVNSINSYIRHTMGENVVSVSHFLGISYTTLSHWQKGLHLPRFPIFLKICHRIGISPLKFIMEEFNDPILNASKKVFLSSYILLSDEELEGRLKALLKEEAPLPSSKGLAKQLQCSEQILRQKFPYLYGEIQQRYQKQQTIEYQKSFLEEVVTANKYNYTTLTQVAKSLGCKTVLLRARFPTLCFQIISKKLIKYDVNKVRLVLEELLASNEIPPPRVREGALRLGCSVSWLHSCLPNTCHDLEKKYRVWSSIQKVNKERIEVVKDLEAHVFEQYSDNGKEYESSTNEAGKGPHEENILLLKKPEKSSQPKRHKKLVNEEKVKQTLEAVLLKNEGPFPTVREVARQLDLSYAVLYNYFPDLCRAIGNRSRKVTPLDQIEKELKVILTSCDDPFPSIEEVNKRVGSSTQIIRRHFPLLYSQILSASRSISVEERANIMLLQEKQALLEKLRHALEGALLDDECLLSAAEIAKQEGSSYQFIQNHFPRLCHAVTKKQRQNVEKRNKGLKERIEIIMLRDQKPSPTVEEHARELGYSSSILRHTFPDLCLLIGQRYASDVSELKNALCLVSKNKTESPSVEEVANQLGYESSVLFALFPRLCRRIQAQNVDACKLKKYRQILDVIVNADQISLSIYEIADKLECSRSFLSSHFPETYELIRRKRLKQIPDEEKLFQVLQDALLEEPPPTLQELANRMDCLLATLSYHFPDLCKAIADRKRPLAYVEMRQQALESFLASEEPVSVKEAAKRLNISSRALRSQFPVLCKEITARYMAARRVKSETRIEKICEEIRMAAFTLHAQGIRPNISQCFPLISNPANFMMSQAKEALRDAMKELGYTS